MAWLIVAIVGFSLAGLALIASVILFFFFNIPSVIGDLTGRTVAREVKAMRAQSTDKNRRQYSGSSAPSAAPVSSAPSRSSSVARMAEQSKRAAPAEASRKKAPVQPPRQDISKLNIETDVLRSNADLEATGVLSDETTLLEGNAVAIDPDDTPTEVLTSELTADPADTPTEVLATNAAADPSDTPTEVLAPVDVSEFADNPTEVLSSDVTGTLGNATTVLSISDDSPKETVCGVFEVVDERIIIHTDEVIA